MFKGYSVNPISLVLLAGLALLVTIWLRSLPRKKRTRTIIMIVITLASLFIILMAVTGRLHWIAAVIAGLLPFSRNLLPFVIKAAPFLGAWYQRKQQAKQQAGDNPEVNTDILSMRFDQDAGVIYGKVKTGPFAGQDLGSLTEKEYITLLDYCRKNDPKSALVLENYLDKRFGDSWREDDSKPSNNNKNTHKEAYSILGLQPGCSREEIINAHRRLMQKNHPDRGGSDYLAAKINKAKDDLLND